MCHHFYTISQSIAMSYRKWEGGFLVRQIQEVDPRHHSAWADLLVWFYFSDEQSFQPQNVISLYSRSK
jgi:hypothetical protein